MQPMDVKGCANKLWLVEHILRHLFSICKMEGAVVIAVLHNFKYMGCCLGLNAEAMLVCLLCFVTVPMCTIW